jgi:hypothetical protein
MDTIHRIITEMEYIQVHEPVDPKRRLGRLHILMGDILEAYIENQINSGPLSVCLIELAGMCAYWAEELKYEQNKH